MSKKQELKTYDLIGIGCGPSNLALAIALEEKKETHQKLKSVFIDKQEKYSWHGNTITGNSQLQVSFLKDLVTLRNPASPYTFINYLQKRKRLVDFINLGTFYPSRLEFNDYLCWVAEHFSSQCRYGEEIFAIEPVVSNNAIKLIRVRSRDTDGNESTRLTRSIVIGTGGSPNIPNAFKLIKDDPRIFHHSQYLESMNAQNHTGHKTCRVAIIGGGQSAAEAFIDIHDKDPKAQIDLIIRGSTLKPSDSSPFVNEIFSPSSTDSMFDKSNFKRDEILDEYRHTNYAAIDLATIEQIYSIFYQQKISGNSKYTYKNHSVTDDVKPNENGISLTIKNSSTGQTESETYDFVVLATGYERNNHRNLLSSMSAYTHEFAVDRNYRLMCDNCLQSPIYLQGYSEHSHGLSDTLLSVLAVRSEEIANDLLCSLSEIEEKGDQFQSDAIAAI